MQSHLGSVILCLARTAWLGLKFFELLRELWVKCTTSAECKTDISAVLTVMSGLDPHMIIELEVDLNRCSYLWLLLFIFIYDYLVGLMVYTYA